MDAPTTEVVADGDIILVVTKRSSTLRFRASSSFLRKASDVFAAMLGPNFLEGQALMSTSGSVCEIALEDDNPTCMRLVLDTVHMNNNRLPKRISAEEVLDLAFLVDKYFLHEIMKLPLANWLIPTKDDDLHVFLEVAIHLNHAVSFNETTRLMLHHHVTSYTKKAGTFDDETMLRLIFSIEQKREVLRYAIIQQLQSIAYLRNDGMCSYEQYIASRFLASLDEFNFTTSGMRNVSLERAFSELSMAIDLGEVVSKANLCKQKRHYHPKLSLLTHMFTERLSSLKNFDGLCLHCEQREMNGDRVSTCQPGHPTWI